jgi:hypothetical protein
MLWVAAVYVGQWLPTSHPCFRQCHVAEGVVALLKAQIPELTGPQHTVHVWMVRPPIGGFDAQGGVAGGVPGTVTGHGPG